VDKASDDLVIVLTRHRPTQSDLRKALGAVTGPKRAIHAVIDLADPDDHEVLARLAVPARRRGR